MFSVSKREDAAFSQQVVLMQTETNTQVVILPACGGILHSFIVQHNGKPINVIESYESDADFKINAEAKGFRNIKMSPFACRIKAAAYKFDGVAYTIEKFLLNGAAIHGLLYNEPFAITNTWANEQEAGVTLLFKYAATDKGYPFCFYCEITYQLKANNSLTLHTTITNRHPQPIPVQDGWHPYFTFGKSINDLMLQFNSKNKVEFDAALIPTGQITPYAVYNTFKKLGDTFFDNCFTLQQNKMAPACIVKDEEQQLQLEVYPATTYPYLQLYTPPHRQSIAVENISAAPDAFNNGMGVIVLQPEASAQFETTYKLSSLL